MSRYDARVAKLEELHGIGDETPCAVVRYNPGEATDWWPEVETALGWTSPPVTLVIIDASGTSGPSAEIIVPPVDCDKLTAEQSAALAIAGRSPGRWWIAIAGRGWRHAVPMHDGEPALLSSLRAQRNRAIYGHNDDL